MSEEVKTVRADEVLWEETRRRVGWLRLRCPLCHYQVQPRRNGRDGSGAYAPFSTLALRDHVAHKHVRGEQRWRWRSDVSSPLGEQSPWLDVLSVLAVVLIGASKYDVDVADLAVATDRLLAHPAPWFEKVRYERVQTGKLIIAMQLDSGEDMRVWVGRIIVGTVPEATT